MAQSDYKTGAGRYRNWLSMTFCEAIFCFAFRRREDFATKKKTCFDFTAPWADAGPSPLKKGAKAVTNSLPLSNFIPSACQCRPIVENVILHFALTTPPFFTQIGTTGLAITASFSVHLWRHE